MLKVGYFREEGRKGWTVYDNGILLTEPDSMEPRYGPFEHRPDAGHALLEEQAERLNTAVFTAIPSDAEHCYIVRRGAGWTFFIPDGSKPVYLNTFLRRAYKLTLMKEGKRLEEYLIIPTTHDVEHYGKELLEKAGRGDILVLKV